MSDKRRNPQPLDPSRLEELALAYVARFATTQAKLRGYLQRKLRERGWAAEGDGEDDDAPQDARAGHGHGAAAQVVEALVMRYAEQGYVDDASWARMKAGSLLRRGYGARRVGEALGQAGVGEALRAEARPGLAEQRRAALILARRRRFGPFAVQPADDPKVQDRQLAAMLRAGHPLDIARRIVESEDADALEQWCESDFGDY